MRNTLLMSVALLGLAGAAFAQTGSTQTPPGGTTSMQTSPGATAGAVPMRKPLVRRAAVGPKGVRPMARTRRGTAIAAQTMQEGGDDASAPPTSAYRGGVGSPLSTTATNLAPSRPEAMGSRLPDPAAAGATPRDLLMAAQRALSQGKTGAAQEALERAETRVLSRTTDPSMAGTPDQAMMVQNISQARRALGARDTAGAQRSISMAMEDRTPPVGPATTTRPGGVPSGGTF